MLNVLKGAGREITAAVLKRLGAIIAAYLVAQGIPPELADQFALALAVVLGLAWDIGMLFKFGSIS